MTHDTKGREVYFKDPKSYYDPTIYDKIAQKARLEAQIRELTLELNDPEKPTLIIGTKKSHVSIQNFINTNREETNEFIANSYYYPVPKSTLEYRVSNATNPIVNRNNNLKKPEVNKHEAINLYTRKPESGVIIGSVNKYYGENNKSTRVEAESSGVVKADNRFYYEDKKTESHKNIENNNKNEVQAAAKTPNTQGLKTAGFRILRKN